ncbi:MAG: D-alanine--D-alanine ligase [Streptococcaceae bacterium]|jgi:D-alanine---D-serine ligase|nr:D-alanine--D-alanine ligase [Streptococcaceae bacterium]
MEKIGVIFGGDSPEYEVSLESAYSVLEALDQERYEILKIGITRDGDWYYFTGENKDIKEDHWFIFEKCERIFLDTNKRGFFLLDRQKYLKVDVLFPVLHGGSGEDGQIQGIFEMIKLPYVGCNTLASAICMDKAILHYLAKSLKIMVTPSIQVSAKNYKMQKIYDFYNKVSSPVFVKPKCGGSSKGISKVCDFSKLKTALKKAAKFDKVITIEKAVAGFEVGCGILGNEELLVGELDEIELASDFFDYTEKYQLLSAKIVLPARISAKIADRVKKYAKHLYQFLGCTGLARIDFFITFDEEIYLNEINTMPGFTNHSRFPSMMRAIGISYKNLVERLIDLAKEEQT